jgi:uncharacterized protein YyaL (SSP411 family)
VPDPFVVTFFTRNLELGGLWRPGDMTENMENKENGREPNRLIREKSPYLLQHAHNPVDWFPWSEEAFEKARTENKPVFLSIGYSTCHWCHVMEKESFEDLEVARLMNEAFVSMKVDREERPDLDHVYMTVCQMMTGSGGWPLTIVMTPDKRPFFAATYIPKGSRFGRTGMMELVPRIRDIWRTRQREVLESAENITAALLGIERDAPGEDLDRSAQDLAYADLAKRFDATYGGFSGAPKFPTPHNFFFMLRYWKRTGDSKALMMVEKTLQEMRYGGIYDQLGFGFHRYSTDREWLVPHFEKMLYDEAMLAMAYIDTFRATGKETYARTAKEIFTYVLRDMRSPGGAFYSAEDADSEGVEGKFYVWNEDEIRQHLDEDEADLVIRVFNVQKNGNYNEEATGKNHGVNILYLGKSISEIAADLRIPVGELETKIDSGRSKLFRVRERRIHPHKDDKILTDWNGLIIAALAQGAQVFDDITYEEAARNAAEFIMTAMRDPAGRLLHRYREGDAGIPANFDDYAFFIWGLIELYEATFDAQYLERALDLNADMVEHFWDRQGGGFFFTPDDGEKLIVRKKEVYDGALPSGNAIAMSNLLRLARFTGQADLDHKASQVSKAFSHQIRQLPSGYTQFLSSVDFGLGPSYEVVVVGPSKEDDTREMLRALRTRYIPNRVLIFKPSDGQTDALVDIAPFTRDHMPVDGKATAYVCRNNSCSMPTTDIDEMLGMLKASR